MDERKLPGDYDIGFGADLGSSRALIDVIDREMDRLRHSCEKDPEWADNLGFDSLEDLIGLGFAACHQLLARTYRRYGSDKRDLLTGGPRPSGRCLSYATIVNAAANFWKHSGEWLPGRTDRREEVTRTILDQLTPTHVRYVMANTLYELLKPEPPRFGCLLLHLEEWHRCLSP